MSPKTRIVTLDDLQRRSNNYDEAAATTGAASTSVSGFSDHLVCKPIGQGHDAPSIIPLCVIPTLPRSEACATMLHRVHEEFLPIIRRRGYAITSMSELCCCGDGLDYAAPNNKKCRKMNKNVWGYNQTTFLGGRRQGGKRRTLHSIHLRLRNPQNHHQMLSYEDVAGTMAHELSHCEHQNHNAAFYKLMEEILEEHALLQAQKLSSSNATTYFGRSTPASAAAAVLPGGHRLGGGGTGTSRLLGETGGGIRLGGPTKNLDRRELAARAAEKRQRQMLQIRRMIERSKEPCVIELFDDDDENSAPKNDSKVVAPDRKRRARKAKTASNNINIHPTKRRTVSQEKDVIDLTAILAKPLVAKAASRRNQKPLQKQPPSANATIDLTGTADESGWSCGLCTYQNRASAQLCDMCHGPR